MHEVCELRFGYAQYLFYEVGSEFIVNDLLLIVPLEDFLQVSGIPAFFTQEVIDGIYPKSNASCAEVQQVLAATAV